MQETNLGVRLSILSSAARSWVRRLPLRGERRFECDERSVLGLFRARRGVFVTWRTGPSCLLPASAGRRAVCPPTQSAIAISVRSMPQPCCDMSSARSNSARRASVDEETICIAVNFAAGATRRASTSSISANGVPSLVPSLSLQRGASVHRCRPYDKVSPALCVTDGD
jgi:hypothetical protein